MVQFGQRGSLVAQLRLVAAVPVEAGHALRGDDAARVFRAEDLGRRPHADHGPKYKLRRVHDPVRGLCSQAAADEAPQSLWRCAAKGPLRQPPRLVDAGRPAAVWRPAGEYARDADERTEEDDDELGPGVAPQRAPEVKGGVVVTVVRRNRARQLQRPGDGVVDPRALQPAARRRRNPRAVDSEAPRRYSARPRPHGLRDLE
mmetsp:Transcript_25782/g.88930  ORF Transcript_25782/g.88930 Transcript_25782/m.88930 type:complete len:202 (-) Transcript_25782:796-1401(-)